MSKRFTGIEVEFAASLRDTLLPRLISGELRVEDVDNNIGEK